MDIAVALVVPDILVPELNGVPMLRQRRVRGFHMDPRNVCLCTPCERKCSTAWLLWNRLHPMWQQIRHTL